MLGPAEVSTCNGQGHKDQIYLVVSCGANPQ